MSYSDKSYSEKRDFIRMTISVPLSAKLSAAGGVVEGECRNLSGGGMLVVTTEDLPVGTELEAEVSSGHGHSPTFRARMRVARNVLLDSGKYELGLETLSMLG